MRLAGFLEALARRSDQQPSDAWRVRIARVRFESHEIPRFQLRKVPIDYRALVEEKIGAVLLTHPTKAPVVNILNRSAQ
jgi:hypothetical protein